MTKNWRHWLFLPSSCFLLFFFSSTSTFLFLSPSRFCLFHLIANCVCTSSILARSSNNSCSFRSHPLISHGRVLPRTQPSCLLRLLSKLSLLFFLPVISLSLSCNDLVVSCSIRALTRTAVFVVVVSPRHHVYVMSCTAHSCLVRPQFDVQWLACENEIYFVNVH